MKVIAGKVPQRQGFEDSENGDKHHEMVNEFYVDYSKLVAKYLDKADPDYKELMLEKFQEMSNVYSCDYERYVKHKF